MNASYEWLYDNYARALQEELQKSEDAVVEETAKALPMSDEDKIDLSDRLTRLRLACGTRSFALGVQLGLRLAWPTVS